MSRRSAVVTGLHGRDKGKSFTIREMDAFSCEAWARDALSAVYRCATEGDQGVLNFISEGIRESFTFPDVPDVELPMDGSMTADHPVIKNTKRQLQADAVAAKADALNAAPSHLAALLGLRLFFQLPFAEQQTALRPLLACVTFEFMGQQWPVMEVRNHVQTVTETAREYIEESHTIAWLQAEAFKMHTDFFMPAVRSISGRLIAAAQLNGQRSETSPAPSRQRSRRAS